MLLSIWCRSGPRSWRLAVFLYVLLDGFDLGVGILYGFAPETERDTVMNAIAPVWDGNETWLILGGTRAAGGVSAGLRDHHSRRSTFRYC